MGWIPISVGERWGGGKNLEKGGYPCPMYPALAFAQAGGPQMDRASSVQIYDLLSGSGVPSNTCPSSRVSYIFYQNVLLPSEVCH